MWGKSLRNNQCVVSPVCIGSQKSWLVSFNLICGSKGFATDIGLICIIRSAGCFWAMNRLLLAFWASSTVLGRGWNEFQFGRCFPISPYEKYETKFVLYFFSNYTWEEAFGHERDVWAPGWSCQTIATVQVQHFFTRRALITLSSHLMPRMNVSLVAMSSINTLVTMSVELVFDKQAHCFWSAQKTYS